MQGLSDAFRFLFIGMFGLAAAAHFIAPVFFRLIYRGTPRPSRVAQGFAIPQALAALFLALPHTHIWGCAIAAMILFMAIVALLQRQRYGLAVLGIAVMTTLPVAIVAAPLA